MHYVPLHPLGFGAPRRRPRLAATYLGLTAAVLGAARLGATPSHADHQLDTSFALALVLVTLLYLVVVAPAQPGLKGKKGAARSTFPVDLELHHDCLSRLAERVRARETDPPLPA